MKLNDIDTILYVDKTIVNEDDRSYATSSPSSVFGGDNININDPKLYSAFAFGKLVQQRLGSDPGIICEVSDFGKWVVVTAGYSNPTTGRISKKTFLIVFELGGDGMVMAASNKWRSISGVDQATSYIRSVLNILKNETSHKL